MATCEFLVKRVNKLSGVTLNLPCGAPGVKYECHGSLAMMFMVLCEHHARHCTSIYQWKLKPSNE